MEQLDRAHKIDYEIKESTQLRIYNQLVYFTDVFSIFEQNYQELLKLLTIFNSPGEIIPFLDDNKQTDYHLLSNELRRCFHNYITSAQTLVCHTRIMLKEGYESEEFKDEYQKMIDSLFSNDPLSVFMRDLRNYTLHYSLPATYSQVQLSQDIKLKRPVVTARVLVHKASLLYSYKWNSNSKKFLSKAPEDIDLLDLIKTHHEKIVSFNKWLLDQLKTIHKNELRWLEDKTSELHKIIDPIFLQP